MDTLSRNTQAGITLIELLAAVAVVTVLAAFGTRLIQSAVYASRSNAGLTNLMSALTTARSTAAASEIDVVLCPSHDGKTCTSGYHWEGGWIAFQATHPGSNRVAGEAIVGRQEAFPSKVHLITTAGRTRIRFQGNGGNAGSNATFTICDGRGARAASAYAMANNGNLRATTASQASVTEACSGF
jgi:type IV fimbrial biogenesis protein FimT